MAKDTAKSSTPDIDYSLLDKVVIKNLTAEPKQYHLRNGLVEGCAPSGVTRPFLKKYLTDHVRDLEKNKKVQIISAGGA
jgi:hypothetical protein